jgi:dolichol-phosphate mannosyltransferase
MPAMPSLSVVLPVYNEEGNLPELYGRLVQVLSPLGDFELIFVDDGSGDGTGDACERVGWVKVIRHARNMGQSAATITGFQHAAGDIIVTLDGDGQNDPAAIPALLDALKTHDVAQGIRARRNDTLWRRFGSRFAWAVRNMVLRDGIKDIGCSLRAFPRHAAMKLPQFNGLHRLMPAIFVFMGMKVAQLPTQHRPRTAGVSKYGNLKRGARGLLDLAGLYWLKRRVFRYERNKQR